MTHVTKLRVPVARTVKHGGEHRAVRYLGSDCGVVGGGWWKFWGQFIEGGARGTPTLNTADAQHKFLLTKLYKPGGKLRDDTSRRLSKLVAGERSSNDPRFGNKEFY